MKTMFHTSGTLHFLEGSLLCPHTACASVLVSFAQSLSLLGCHFSGGPLLWIPLVEQCPFVCHWLSTYSKPCFFKALNIRWNECSMQARFLLLLLILIILCVWIFCVNVCLYITYMGAMPREARWGCQMYWHWIYRGFLSPLWVLGIESRTYGKATSAPNCWAISQSQYIRCS